MPRTNKTCMYVKEAEIVYQSLESTVKQYAPETRVATMTEGSGQPLVRHANL